MRYADWTLGAPELEAGIACASMAQDEWGHARQLYALLRDFGDDTEQLEHGREPAEYRSMSLLDQPPGSWPELVVLNALVDTAFTVQFDSLTASTYVPLRSRCEKLLEEERFHLAHGSAWFRRLASASDAARNATRAAAERALPAVLQWFGAETGATSGLRTTGVSRDGGDELRRRYLERVAALLTLVGVDGNAMRAAFDGFREDFRRPTGTAPDASVIAKVRGDLNRVFLMD
jgi:ring-1,2-phenylacetyl-CoA epoxidase subunit PaaC